MVLLAFRAFRPVLSPLATWRQPKPIIIKRIIHPTSHFCFSIFSLFLPSFRGQHRGGIFFKATRL
jgi:hypothetical protein